MPNPRVLKIAVVVMGLLLVAGFAVVIVTIVLRASKPEAARTVEAPRDLAVALEPRGRVQRVFLEGNRLMLHLADGAGQRIVVVDLARGRTTDVIRLGPAGAGAPSEAPAPEASAP